MTEFTIHALQDSSILALNDMRERIKLDPEYQRPGGVWPLSKKQLFIDSLLNGYDIPKLYFHHLTESYKSDDYRYAIIDGRQRLEAIWGFIKGDFALSPDFVYYEEPTYNVAGLTFDEIAKLYPRLSVKFHSRNLTVMVVTADDLDFIEDMFSRLNEAVPLNAAEKRNAFGGPLPEIIRDLSQHRFFENKTRISPSRYRHLDLTAKMLYQEYNNEIVDTKKTSLDYFVKDHRSEERGDLADVEDRTRAALNELDRIFINKDPLLKSAGMHLVYYVLVSRCLKDGNASDISRGALVEFEEYRRKNREKFENEHTDVDLRLIEFDELAQSANDGAAIRQRYELLRKHLQI